MPMLLAAIAVVVAACCLLLRLMLLLLPVAATAVAVAAGAYAKCLHPDSKSNDQTYQQQELNLTQNFKQLQSFRNTLKPWAKPIQISPKFPKAS